MADLKPLQLLLLMAPLLIAFQLDSIFANTDKPTPNLPQETTKGGGPLSSSSDSHLPPPPNKQRPDPNRIKELLKQFATQFSQKRFRSHRASIRKRRRRRRQRAFQRASRHYSSQSYIPTVSLPNICFAILSSILHNLVTVNSH
ncbi:unnamed protein product [Citrullus colocynthis]|uniref:Uncharacterized protein n=1 Tax=Citrullus colocynthis TaxID=252529 RepID=A0ABP0ZAF6_9ROSI